MVVSKNIERIWIQIRKHNADPGVSEEKVRIQIRNTAFVL